MGERNNMKKPDKLKPGDLVAIVSLSSGMLGEKDNAHTLELGVKRLKEFGLETVFMPNALKGSEFIKNNPQARANDLKKAFLDPKIKAIITAVGGDDTFRTLPFLLDDEEFKTTVLANPKIFMGSSDTTINHLMFQKLGLNTFYGHSFLPVFGELEDEMLPYSKEAFEMLFTNQEETEILPSKD
jgi:muramoyltetrapeptide carboxypeptidase LdcA involved in peptidoglycan recycling